MKDKLENFIEKMTTSGVEVVSKKHYVKFANNVRVIAKKKKLRVYITGKVNVNGLAVSDVVKPLGYGRYTRFALANAGTVDSLLETVGNILTTETF